MKEVDFTSFMIGLLLGMIMMLLLVWAAYAGRVFLFTYCAKSAPYCTGSDYYNDPGDALANDQSINVPEILYLNSNDEMFYRRVPKNSNCTPQGNQTVYMKYPQYCSFNNSSGVSGVWKETAFNSNIYDPITGHSGLTGIQTSGNCDPVGTQYLISGIPLLEWDPN
jgi:hypothetical protein